MKKIKLNVVAEAVAEANGGMISTELMGVLKKAHAAGLNAEAACAFERIPAEPSRITYGCPLSEEAEAVLLICGRMGDREAKRVFFAAYEGLVRKRAAPFYHHGNGRRQEDGVSEKPGRKSFISREQKTAACQSGGPLS